MGKDEGRLNDVLIFVERDGRLELHRRDMPDSLLACAFEVGWEPLCVKCGEPIRWVLDMFSFTPIRGGHALAHARCVWKPEAFDRERDAGANGP